MNQKTSELGTWKSLTSNIINTKWEENAQKYYLHILRIPKPQNVLVHLIGENL